MVSLDKKYRTRDGRKVRIYAVDGRPDGDSVHGAVLCFEGWRAAAWKPDGRYFHRNDDDMDLIEAKNKHEGWLNIYRSRDVFLHENKEQADGEATEDRVACIHVEWEA